MPKLTLSVDDEVISRAKRYAKQHGVSVSAMVEAYLDSVAASPSKEDKSLPPVLRSMRGMLKNADRETHRQHLANKYR
jgi:hypothetical protein